MPRRLVLAVLVLACALAGAPGALAAPSDLFFSEYIEGSSNNKALEIFNGTGAPVDLATGGYNVQMFFNGATTATLTINLTGNVANGDVFVLAQSSANATILAQADQTNGSGWFNGDDAVVLRKGTTVLDVIGQIGIDPGTEWGTGLTSTADNTLRRKASVQTGDTNGSDAFDPAVAWDGFATDTFDGLGTHAVTAPGDDAPSVASTTPANGAIDVSRGANIVVTFSEPVTVTGASFALSCETTGVHSFSLSGSSATYTLDPAADFGVGETCTLTVDDQGVTDVDTDDPPDTMAADRLVRFTTLGVEARIYEIQGAAHLSPLGGKVVSNVPGVVTSVRPNSFTMQDATGDGSAATSDAILVFANGIGGSVSVGQAVTVSVQVSPTPKSAAGSSV
jgi:predicted extracellular nuclease